MASVSEGEIMKKNCGNCAHGAPAKRGKFIWCSLRLKNKRDNSVCCWWIKSIFEPRKGKGE